VFAEGTPLISELHLGGGTPTFFSPENLRRMVSGILQQVKITPDAVFSFEAHPANTTKGHLGVLYELGFKRLSLGIQDFDPGVQAIINRRQTLGDVRQVMENARYMGYESINFDLIYGLPAQTIASMEDTLEKVLSLRP